MLYIGTRDTLHDGSNNFAGRIRGRHLRYLLYVLLKVSCKGPFQEIPGTCITEGNCISSADFRDIKVCQLIDAPQTVTTALK